MQLAGIQQGLKITSPVAVQLLGGGGGGGGVASVEFSYN